jgi:TolB-like protein/Tfp pilus assembly protein PilF
VIRSLAVLPFQNLSGDQGQDYVADGMTDELITMLAKNPGLRIISRTSAMQYKNVHRPLPDIARELGVDGILEGSVGRSGGRVHVTAQLIYAPTDSHIWAESYDRDLSYVYSLQNELALNIARHVGLTASVPAELETRVNPEAYEAYLRARHFANIRGPALRKAVEYYQQATEKEPTFALAYAGLAESQWRSGDFAAAKRSANKAIQIDGTMGEPLATLAQIKAYNEWDFSGAEEDFKRAIALSPNDPTARQWYAQFLHWMGRLDEGMAQIQVGQQLDPLSLVIGTDRAEILLHMNQLDAATAQIKKVVELDSEFGPAHLVLARIYERQRKYDAAISEYGVVGGKPNDPTILAFQAMVYAEAGRTKKAREILSRAEKLAAQSSLPYDGCALASAYGVLGDKDKAFFWLEREYLARSPSLLTLKVHESFAPLRSDRRFEDLVRRIGFPK